MKIEETGDGFNGLSIDYGPGKVKGSRRGG